MYGLRGGSDTEMEGWYHADRFDLFLWFKGNALAHLQVCAGMDVLDWSPSRGGQTGRLRGRDKGIGVQAAREDTIVDDRQLSSERVQRIVKAIQESALPLDVRDYSVAAVTNAPSSVSDRRLADAVRILPAASGRA